MQPSIHLTPTSQIPEGTNLEGDESSYIDEVYDKILLRIIRGDYLRGTVLTSSRLADELKVSRTPVAVAIDRLVADGILEKEKNKRAIVCDGAEEWLLQVHQLREMLEPRAAALAASRISDEDLRELDQMAVAANPASGTQWQENARVFDFALHLAIADNCGNLPLQKAIHKCWSYKRLSYEAGLGISKNLEVGYSEHIAILKALSRRDSKTASVAMLFHLRSAANLTTERRIV